MISNIDPSAGAPRDTANDFRVVVRGDGLIGVYALSIKHLTPDEAFKLGIWLVALSDATPSQILRGLTDIAKKSS